MEAGFHFIHWEAAISESARILFSEVVEQEKGNEANLY
jgi:hypothetical protein